MRKTIPALILAGLMAAFTAGCGSSSSATTTSTADTTDAAATTSAEETTTAAAETTAAVEGALHDLNGDGKLIIYGIYKSGDQTWFQNEGAAAKALVEAAGGEFIYVDVQNDGQQELDAVSTAITGKADGIITCTPDQTISGSIVNLCESADIPVVACDDALEDANGIKLVPWVGISDHTVGESVGNWICDYIEDNYLSDDKTCGLLMMTMSANSSYVSRTDGEKEILDERCPGIEKSGRLFTVDYDGTAEAGNIGAAGIFAANPDITKWIVFGANEEGVAGAVRALEAAGLDENAVCVGMGAYLAKDEYKNGSCMAAAPFFSDAAVGEYSAQIIFDLIDGKDVEMESAVFCVMTTPSNYQDIMGEEAD